MINKEIVEVIQRVYLIPGVIVDPKALRVFKMGKQRKYLVLAPLAPITASRTSLQQPQPTPEYIVGRGGGWRWNTSNIIHISVY